MSSGACERNCTVTRAPPLLLCCILAPPLAIVIDAEGCDDDFGINCCLTLMLWIPGVIHAIYTCFFKIYDDDYYVYGPNVVVKVYS
ncbi:hypothetical protein L596_019458 [Steinernema carpocapsae]|uniref:Uncharacterized protein n=1 Tax=Steinernema carpocapsae TaxID=34508 RepID=A0A4U5MQK6_STECR|nr:hypothetical protein L596_019458 [Steinernema carpocapsae]